MCGRYLRRTDKESLAEAFQGGKLPDGIVLPPWDYNIAPTTFQPVVRQARDSSDRELVLMRWSLVPQHTKDITKLQAFSTINARAETVQTSPMWQGPFQRHRCLVPADGFYEWRRPDPKTKIPYACTLKDGGTFAFAGLWDAWQDPRGDWLQSFAIITTDANEAMAPIHNRMPVILHPQDYDRWLDRGEAESPPVDLLRPYESDRMRVAPANPLVGNVRNNGPEMLGGG